LQLHTEATSFSGARLDMLPVLCLRAKTILQTDFAAICLLNDAGTEASCILVGAESSVGTEYKVALSPSTSLFQFLHSENNVVVLDDLDQHPAFDAYRAVVNQIAVRSLMAIPVCVHGEVVGKLLLGQNNQRRAWTDDDRLFAHDLGGLIQQALCKKAHHQLQHEMELRVQQRTAELSLQTMQLELAQRNIYQLSEIGREITSSLDREIIMDIVYRHVHDLMGAEVFAVGLYRPEQGLIEFPCNILRGDHMLPYSRNINEPDLLSAWCVKHQKEIFINDIFSEYQHYISRSGLDKLTVDASYPDGKPKMVPVSHIYAPMIIKHRVTGVIAIQSTAKNAFQRMHVDMAVTLAAYTAIALDNADTYQQLVNTQQILVSQEKLAALGALVAGIAHELNTPIGNSLLTASTLQEQSNQFMKKMAANSLRKSDLTTFAAIVNEANELLMRNLTNAGDLVSSFKQVSVDQTSQQRRAFNLAQTTHEVVRTLSNQISKQGHTLEVDIPPDIMFDSFPGPYGQILTNFILNAMLHGFENIAHGQMHLSASMTNSGQVQIIFSDNGRGIREEDLRRIFDPFFTTKLGRGGSGLGLSIVHNLVTTIMGGKIDVSSVYGSGTRFTLLLPLKP
ncbi:MAG: GAF domain-containing protein, partial [Burkholderiales bacterium]|nr:GAF domain-containing protein [Burkholderiales bacterium]